MNSEKILITGGTGFIGANLLRYFLSKGYEVSTIVRNQSNLWRISDLTKYVDMINVGIYNSQKVLDLIKSQKPTIIINTMAFGGYHFETDVNSIINTNFNATVNLVEAYLKSNSNLLINTGSSSEYGFKDDPMSEWDILNPIGAYAVSKAAATMYCKSRSIEESKKIATFRIFSAYGDYEESHRLIPYLVTSAIWKRKARLSRPTNLRDFIYIDDINKAYLKLIEMSDSVKNGEILNLGTGNESSVGDVVELLTKILNRDLDIEWSGEYARKADVSKHWVANTKKLKETLNYTPETSLKDGLSKTYEWFIRNISKYEVMKNSKFERIGK